MPYAMPWSGQPHKWFSIVIFIGLPFYVLYKSMTKSLPSLREVGPKYI